MRVALVDLLQGDTELAALLPGGVFDADEVDEISRQNTPGAFDANSELQACVVVRARGPVALVEPYLHGARQTIEIYLYQAPDAARERIYDLLHDTRLQPAGSGSTWRIEHADDVLGQEDQALRARLTMSRFTALVRRR